MHRKVGRRVTEGAVGSDDIHIQRKLTLVHRIIVVEQPYIPRPRRGPAHEPGKIAPVAHTIPGFGFSPDIGVDGGGRIIGIEPDGGIGLAAADLLEAAANNHVAIGQNLRRKHIWPRVRIRVRIERIIPLPLVVLAMKAGKLVIGGVEEGGIDRAVGIEPGNAKPVGAVERSEDAAHIHAAIWLRANIIDGVIGSRPRIERVIHRAVAVQPGDARTLGDANVLKLAANYDLRSALYRHGVNDAVHAEAEVRIESRISTAIGVEPSQASEGLPAQMGELATDNDFAVRLLREAPDGAIRSIGTRVEAWIQRAVRIISGDMSPRDLTDHREVPGDNHLVVGLDHQRPNGAIRVLRRRKRPILQAVRIEAGNELPIRAIVLQEGAADHHLPAAVGQQGERTDHPVIGAGARVKTGVDWAVGRGAGDATARSPIIRRELTRYDRLVIGLHGQGPDRAVRPRVGLVRWNRRHRGFHLAAEIGVVKLINRARRRVGVVD